MQPKNNSKIILKQWVQVFLIMFVLAILAASIWSIVRGVNGNETGSKELYSYNYNSDLSYKVYLKPNSFYNESYLDMNKQYIASLIDHIDVNTNYKMHTTKDVAYTYTYQIVATAHGSYSESDGNTNQGDVWSKTYTVLPTESKNGTGSEIVVDKTVSIDYNQYNEILTQFRNEFGLSVDASVDVAFKITVSAGLPGEKSSLSEENKIALKIPLLKTTIALTPDYVNSGGNTVYEQKSDNGKQMNIPLIVIGIIGLLVSLVLFKILCGKLLKTTRKSEYMLQLNKILKEYGDVIAEAENMPNLSQYDVVNIKEFKDLVDIEEELHSPIIFNDVYEETESWFMIFHAKTAYKYVLKADDFDRIIKR